MPTITGPFLLPGKSTPLRGVWSAVAVAADGSGIVADDDGALRGGVEEATDDGDGAGATMVLPVPGWYDFSWRSLDRSGGREIRTSTMRFNLTADTTWAAIRKAQPGPGPITPTQYQQLLELIGEGGFSVIDNGDGTVTVVRTGDLDDPDLVMTLLEAAADVEAAKELVLAVPTTTNALVADAVDDEAGPTRARLQASFVRGVNVEAFGAIGDGVADDRVAWVAAMDSVALLGGRVYGRPDATYLIGTADNETGFRVPSGSTTMAVCLAIPDGVTVDGRGCTFLKGNLNAVLFTNAGSIGSTKDASIGLVNVVLDGDDVALINRYLVQINGVANLQMDDVTVQNVHHGGIFMMDIDHLRSTRMEAKRVVGQPFTLGFPTAGLGVRDAEIGILVSQDVTPDPSNLINFPGNILHCEMQDFFIDTIVGRSCSAGVKMGETCADGEVGKVIMRSIGDTAGNSGYKLQGTGAAGPYRIHTGQILARNCAAHGLWMEKCIDSSVGSYIGRNNQSLATGPDVWIGGTRDKIASIHSENAGGDGVLVRQYATDAQVGRVTVRNPGQVPGAASKRGVSLPGGTGSITDLRVLDDQGAPTMTHGLSIPGTTAAVLIGRARITGAATAAYSLVAGAAVQVVLEATGTGSATLRVVPTGSAQVPTAGSPRTGSYWLLGNQLTTLAGAGIGTLRLYQILVPSAISINRIGAEVTAAGEAGSKVRLVIYADDGAGSPGALLLDAGTIAGDSATVQELTVNQALSPGLYWVGAVIQDVAATQPTMRAISAPPLPLQAWTAAIPAANQVAVGVSKTGVTGAAPSALASLGGSGSAVRIFFKVA